MPNGSQRTLVDGIRSGSIHNGGRLAIGPEGDLFAATGDAGDRSLPRRDGLNGRILRIDVATGKVTVVSTGHRNPQGLCFDGSGEPPVDGARARPGRRGEPHRTGVGLRLAGDRGHGNRQLDSDHRPGGLRGLPGGHLPRAPGEADLHDAESPLGSPARALRRPSFGSGDRPARWSATSDDSATSPRDPTATSTSPRRIGTAEVTRPRPTTGSFD